MKTVIEKEEITYALSNMAYVIADMRDGTVSGHALHQVADICEAGNIDRVDDLLRLHVAEITAATGGRLSVKPSFYRGDFPAAIVFEHSQPCHAREAVWVRETLKEYLTSAVLASWLGVTLPEAAGVWKEKSEGQLRALCRFRPGAPHSCRRAVPPI